MAEVVGIKLKEEMVQYFDPQGLDLNKGDLCITEGEEGSSEIGEVITEIKIITPQEVHGKLKRVLRKLGKEDLEQLKLNKIKEKDVFRLCQRKIKEAELDMKLIKVEYNFDRSKAIFYFCSENRIDFRELVKDLAHEMRTRIEMRQIGVRDEAKMIGSFGHCGRSLCCATFLKEFSPVSMQMVKVQNLASNPSKLSGACGRLMCCLKYEYNFYRENSKKFPRIGTKTKVKDETGIVNEVNIVKGTYKVKFEDGREVDVQVY
jgi:cell fate regulator YaaT (PSP1 superfamily)